MPLHCTHWIIVSSKLCFMYDLYLAAHNTQRAFSLVEVALNWTPFHLFASLFFSMLLLLLLLLLQQLLTIQVDTIYYIHIIFYLILMRIDFAVATHMVPVILIIRESVRCLSFAYWKSPGKKINSIMWHAVTTLPYNLVLVRNTIFLSFMVLH